MQNKTFVFFKKDRGALWTRNRDEFTAFVNDIFRNSNFGNFKNDFEIEVKKICKKRSGQQLRAYWRLIHVLKNWMNEQGNLFTDEQVSAWVKIQAGHYQEIQGDRIAKSIANKSDAIVEDMIRIIEFIIDFGKNWGIKDCFIATNEYDEILDFYRI